MVFEQFEGCHLPLEVTRGRERCDRGQPAPGHFPVPSGIPLNCVGAPPGSAPSEGARREPALKATEDSVAHRPRRFLQLSPRSLLSI